MKVEIKLSEDVKEPFAIIYAESITEEIQEAVEILEKKIFSLIPVNINDKITLIPSNEIFMVRTENGQVIVYTDKNKYTSKRRLYEIEDRLSNDFFRISKSTIINLKQIDNVAPSLGGMMFINLKNGVKDNISRKYLPEFKRKLGL